jgi:hypothetical protein
MFGEYTVLPGVVPALATGGATVMTEATTAAAQMPRTAMRPARLIICLILISVWVRVMVG